jgi:acetyl-CoA/propionyl-CoA carboxylase biotin carboxyl carrier protein
VADRQPPFERLVIANRGEIAVRVLRACRELGVSPIAVYGPGEENALHVRMADDAYRLEASDRLPYLNGDAIIEIARRSGAGAIHPGYGFLAENATFAESCALAGIAFVGPGADAIRQMGDKIVARSIATSAGVPVVPGTDGPLDSPEAAQAWASEHGYPIAVKAAAGGGGRGFRVAHSPDELADAFLGSAGEAERYFANPVVYLERYLVRPRHIEVQLFADNHGNVVWLGERDCSVQRRHQKLIEETPSTFIDAELRTRLGESTAALARTVGYSGAGTVEFMVTEDRDFYFLEMNTRIQVEHTITEEVTGFDLVKEQISVAAGEKLSFTQDDIAPRGHAIQCRINAEDAGAGFQPVPGTLTALRWPSGPGIRVDTAMEAGASILPAYDSLIAKLVARGRDREEATARMLQALREFHIEGVPTTIPFHARVLESASFADGDVTTAFLPEHPEVIPPASTAPVSSSEQSANEAAEYLIEVNGRRLSVRVTGDGLQPAPSKANGPKAASPSRARGASGGGGNSKEVVSPLQGTILRVAVEAGSAVDTGDLLCVVEAMKMENEITAQRAGEIASVDATPGATVSVGSVLLRYV